MTDQQPKSQSIKERTEPNSKKARTRSPAYPGINLETAIKRAKEFYDNEKMNAAVLRVAVKHWGFKEKSSGGLITAAALISFGLMSGSGSGAERRLQLTQHARRILLDQRPDSPEREQAIKQAALLPKIYAALWEKWGTELPSDDNFSHELVVERKFNEKSAKSFIKLYKDTIGFAKLADSDTISATEEDTGRESQVNASAGTLQSAPTGAISSRSIGQRVTTEISVPVGLSEEGQAVFARVSFDAPLKKEFLSTLQTLLGALEKSFK